MRGRPSKFGLWVCALVAGLGLASVPTGASALAIGTSCAADFGAVAGPGSYANACGAGRIIDNTLTALGGARADAANWDVMGGDYGVFDLTLGGADPHSAIFRSLSAGNTHRFGWADTSGGTLINIIDNTQTQNPGDISPYAPTETSFLFFAQNTRGSQRPNLFYTDRDLNSFGGVDDFQHVMILQGEFDGRTEFLLFIEDLVEDGARGGLNSDNDYNDIVLQVQFSRRPITTPNDVSDPASMVLFAAALLGLGVARRRRIG